MASLKVCLLIALSLSIALPTLFSCSCTGGGKDKDSIKIQPIDSLDVPDIVEAVGTIGEGTSMNSLEFINDKGDTVYIECPSILVTGGAVVGDRISVIYNTDGEYNSMMASVNMTALEHLWSQRGSDGKEQSLEFNDNGRATTYDMNVDYNGWSIKDGKLLLYSPKKTSSEQGAVADTFEIVELSEEKLVLANGNLNTEFERAN